MNDSLWDNLGDAEPAQHTSAQSKRPTSVEDAPVQQPMKAGLKPAQRKAPSADQKKHRRQQAKQAASPSTKESATMTQPTEEELLTRLAMATTLAEQTEISGQIEVVRAARREHLSREASLDWGALDTPVPAGIAHLPVHNPHVAAALENTHIAAGFVTDATDWLDDVLPSHTADATVSAQMRAQATQWYNHEVWAPVKDSAEEFSVQAHNAARRAGAQYGLQSTAAASVFLAQVDHLRTKDSQPRVTTAAWGDDPFAAVGPDPTVPTYVSDGRDGLPVGVDPAKAETFDEDTLGSSSGKADPKSSQDTGAAKSLDEGSTPEGDSAASSENPLTGQTGLDHSSGEFGDDKSDRMSTQGAQNGYKGPGFYIRLKDTKTIIDGPTHTREQAQKVIDDNAINKGAYEVVELGDDSGHDFLPDKGNSKVPSNFAPKSSSLQTEADLSDEELRGLVAQQNHLSEEWDKAFADLKAARVSHDADHPAAAKYRAASDAVNHVNRKLDYYVSTGRVHSKPGQPYTVKSSSSDNHAPCPNHPGQSYNKSTGDCSCGSNHRRWASSENPGGQKKSSLFDAVASFFGTDAGIQTYSGQYAGGSPKHGDTATCHADDQPIEFFDGQWMHYAGGPRHNDVYPATPKERAEKAKSSHLHTADLRPATPEEEQAWLSGYVSIPGAEETDAGLLVPEDFHLASRRTADYARNPQGNPNLGWVDDPSYTPSYDEYRSVFPNGVPLHDKDLTPEQAEFLKSRKSFSHLHTADAVPSKDGLGEGIDEGANPEGDHSESATQETPSGDLDKSHATPSDNLPTGGEGDGVGVNWANYDRGSAVSAHLSKNARTFVAALAKMDSLDDVVAGVSGHRVARLLAADPTCPSEVREALKAGGNPFFDSRTAATYSEEDKRKIMGPKGHEISAEQAKEILTKAVAGGYNARVYGLAHNQIVTLSTPDALDKFSGSLELIWQSKAGVGDLVSKAAKSDICPRCGSHMDDVTVHGDTLKAKCGNCGWSGSKKKSSLSTEAAAEDYDASKGVPDYDTPKKKSSSLSLDLSAIAANLSTVASRFEVKKDAVHPYHGIWDTKQQTWHEGDYDNATYAAGVPMWHKREDAQSVVDRLNR